MTNQTHREWIYRMAYEAGRHVIGYEVQKVLSGIDWFESRNSTQAVPIGVAGYGEGGLLALYAASLDPRIQASSIESQQTSYTVTCDSNRDCLSRVSRLEPIDSRKHFLHFVPNDMPAGFVSHPIDPLAVGLIGHPHAWYA